MKELADILEISHANTNTQENQLVRKGYMKREPRKARGIVILRQPTTKKRRTITMGQLTHDQRI